MMDSEHEDEEHGETKQMSMHKKNWRRQSTSLSQLEITTINEYFNDLTDYVGSMMLVLKITDASSIFMIRMVGVFLLLANWSNSVIGGSIFP